MQTVKKELIRTLIMICACVVCVVSVTYSWLANSTYFGRILTYHTGLQIVGNRVDNEVGVPEPKLGLYHGVFKDDNTFEYEEIPDEGIKVSGLLPGDREYFKVTIRNETDKSAVFSLNISYVIFDKELDGLMSISTTSPEYHNTNLLGTTCSEEQNILSDIPLLVRKTLQINETVEIFWFIEFDEEIGNDCMGKQVYINAIQVVG